jgi:predicted RNA-binding protein YlqC (UPF0109 family)
MFKIDSLGKTESSVSQGEEAMKELILRIVRAMVDHPEAVRVSEISGDQMTVFELNVAKEDLGKVIGKQGQNAKAIRTILNAASSRDRRRSVLEIIDK